MKKYAFLVLAVLLALTYLVWPATGEVAPKQGCGTLVCRSCDASGAVSQDEFEECLAIRGYERKQLWFGGYHILRDPLFENDKLHRSLAVMSVGAALLGAIYFFGESRRRPLPKKEQPKPAG